MRTIPEERKKFIVSDYQNGLKIKELYTKHGVTPATIRKILKEAGVYKADTRKISEERQNLIVSDYQNGVIPTELCAKYHCAQKTVYKILKEAGVYQDGRRTPAFRAKMAEQSRKLADTRNRLIERDQHYIVAHQASLPIVQMSRDLNLGVSGTRKIARFMKKNNIEPPISNPIAELKIRSHRFPPDIMWALYVTWIDKGRPWSKEYFYNLEKTFGPSRTYLPVRFAALDRDENLRLRLQAKAKIAAEKRAKTLFN